MQTYYKKNVVTTGVISLTDCPNRDSPWPWPLSEQWDTCIMPCLFHIPQLRRVIWSCVPINNRESKSWCFFCAINPHGRNSLIFEASSRHWNVVETCNCCLFISYEHIGRLNEDSTFQQCSWWLLQKLQAQPTRLMYMNIAHYLGEYLAKFTHIFRKVGLHI